jgi:hydroxymethylbilane synthase
MASLAAAQGTCAAGARSAADARHARTAGAPVTLRVATRGSALARWQAERVARLLGGEVELVIVQTTGDRRADEPLHRIGGAGVFVKEVQEAVLDGRAELAVHSAKDLPADTPDGLVLAAFPERADARDALVGSALDDLPTGAVVATGSVRRRAQLAAVRPDLGFAELRGNIQTRLDKAEAFDAIVVAAAALDRLDLGARAAERLSLTDMVPQVGQGALAVECRTDDAETRARRDAIDDTRAHAAVTAERAFLAALGGGCTLPVGAHAEVADDSVAILGLVASDDGRRVARGREVDSDPEQAGRRIATRLMAGFEELS